ncbi:hypothetical protein [Halorubrum halophilum]|nr:hypothetical protein [Halorubrum halophilum]
MSVTGVCQICEAVPARHGCPQCGSAVCDSHWTDTLGVCTSCAKGRQQ